MSTDSLSIGSARLEFRALDMMKRVSRWSALAVVYRAIREVHEPVENINRPTSFPRARGFVSIRPILKSNVGLVNPTTTTSSHRPILNSDIGHTASGSERV